MVLLPRFFVLQSRGKYLSIKEGQPSGFLKFDEEQIWNPRVKFAAELAKSGDEQLVHIRSCYNNKYWVENQIKGSMIVATGMKPEEDQLKASCTLFQPNITKENKGQTVSLICSRTRNVVKHLTNSHFPHVDVLFSHVLIRGAISMHVFNVIDWETLVILPTQVSFRSEELNGKYLCSRALNPRWPYQRFESGMDISDPRVAKELFPAPNGNYRIKDVHFGKFWRRSPNWIWADAEDNNNSSDTLFSIVKISDTVIGLRNLGNNNFCGGLTTERKTNCLNAHYPTLSRQARLLIDERVLDREISDVRYRISDSRIYQEEIQEVSHAFASNDSPYRDSTVTLTYSTSDSRSTHWTNSVSIKFGVSVKFTTSTIPFIASGEVQVSTEFGYSHGWGVSKTTVHTRQASYTVVVPPLTTMKVTLMCTKGACDVPFSYIQRDLLTTGKRVSTTKNDGIYTGINNYNFRFLSSKERKLKEYVR